MPVSVTGYIGVWVDEYADEPGLPDVDVISVAYYTAVPVDDTRQAFDRREVSELAWFGRDELPDPLVPPGTLEAVLSAARSGVALSDRPNR